MPTYVRQFLAATCLLGIASIAKADLIFAHPYGISDGGRELTGPIRLVYEFTADPSVHPISVAPLFDLSIHPADAGKVFTADSSTPFFAENVALATDGINNSVGIFLGGAGALIPIPEDAIIFGGPQPPVFKGAPDLKGYSIKRATLRIDQFVTLPNEAVWYDHFFGATVSYFDDENPLPTPEPTSVGLALLGAGCILVWHKRKTRNDQLANVL